jgi:protein O-GlcNAc transferase
MSRASTKNDINRDFQSALSALQVGNLGAAERCCDAVLRVDRKHAGALNVMAVVLSQLGRFAEAETYFHRAVRHHRPSDGTLYNYGIVLKLLDRPAEALQRFSEAIGINPSIAETWNHRGATLHDLTRYDEAVADFDRATALNPRFADAFINKGKSLLALERGDEALAAFNGAIAINRGLAEAWLGRGQALGALGNYDEGLSAYDHALALNPDYAEASLGRGHVLAQLLKYGDALTAYNRAIALRPDLVQPWLVRGLVLSALEKEQAALADFDRALMLDPNLAEAAIGRGNSLLQLQRYEDALAAFDRALDLNANLPYVAGDRLHVKLRLSDWTNLDVEISELVAAVRAQKPATAPFQFFAISASPADQLQCAKRFVADQPSFPAIWRGEVYAHDRLRLGYFSADFCNHAVGQSAVGLFEAHDRSRFETVAISFGLDDGSDLRRRIKSAFEDFIDVREWNDADIAALIRRREIDIIIDLTGLTRHNRFSVLSPRVAPIQINFLGHAGTIGAGCVDYIVADRTLIPEEHFKYYSERVVWLPDTYLPNAYRAQNNKHNISERVPPTRAECNLPEAAFVFCCFNNTYKINPLIFDVWMRLLRAVPESVLWLSKPNSTAELNLGKEAELRGVSRERIIFAPKLNELSDHLARQRQADLFLDTLPYNAHTTASDALWAGLPVLTCLGETFAGRVAASVLNAIGLPELITTSLDDYEALAVKLAREPSLLASITAKLACNRDTYPLFGTARFTRHIEAAYTMMWQRHQSGEVPQAFAVQRVG